jgi:hypothetical protein
VGLTKIARDSISHLDTEQEVEQLRRADARLR